MKYVIPIEFDQADAVKLLGTLPPTASAVRNALKQKVPEILKNYEPPVEKAETTVEEGETPTPKKSTRKTTKR